MSTYCRYCTYLPVSKKFIAEGQTRLSFPEKKLLRWNCIAPVRQKLISKEEGGKKRYLSGWLTSCREWREEKTRRGHRKQETHMMRQWKRRGEAKQSNGMSAQHTHIQATPIPLPPAHIFTHKHTHTETETRLTLPSWYKTSSKEGRTEKKRKKGETMCMKHTMSEGCNVSKHP